MAHCDYILNLIAFLNYFMLFYRFISFLFFFFNDTATTEIYTLSLHDALPIYIAGHQRRARRAGRSRARIRETGSLRERDRKSTRLNSSHLVISYAVFCLKKKETSLYHQNPPFFGL